MVPELSSATFSSNVNHCILLVSLYVIYVIYFFGMFTILDYSSASEYSIIRRYTNIVYNYYLISASLLHRAHLCHAIVSRWCNGHR